MCCVIFHLVHWTRVWIKLKTLLKPILPSNLGSGNITYYENAFILSTAPIYLIGTCISTAAFPRLNARLSQGQTRSVSQRLLNGSASHDLDQCAACGVCFLWSGLSWRVMIYSQGGPQIATIFGFLALAIFFRILYTIISRWFYAQKDTKTPLFVSLFVISLNVFLAMTLARPEPIGYGVRALAMAQVDCRSGGGIIICPRIMLIRDHRLFNAQFWGGVVRYYR